MQEFPEKVIDDVAGFEDPHSPGSQ